MVHYKLGSQQFGFLRECKYNKQTSITAALSSSLLLTLAAHAAKSHLLNRKEAVSLKFTGSENNPSTTEVHIHQYTTGPNSCDTTSSKN